MNFKISYAVTASDQSSKLEKLLLFLKSAKRDVDEIIIQGIEGKVSEEVKKVAKENEINLFEFDLNKNTESFANNFKNLCSGNYIFLLHEYEMPANETVENLHRILESNIDVDLFLVPRVNIVKDLPEGIKLKSNENQWLNWPDYQHRIIKNNFQLKWEEFNGEVSGASTGVKLPETAEYAIVNVQSFEENRKHVTKSKNVTLCMVVANSDDCLDRFFNWAIPRFEKILIVRSDSEDDTDLILGKYKNKHPEQIEVKYNKIETIAKQKQYCVDASKTEWNLIIDADEVIEDYDWDRLVQYLDHTEIDLCHFPRYNLQVDEENYLPQSYPDYQPRLFNSKVSFSKEPIHETHHAMIGHRKDLAMKNVHLIHWGHIRSESQNLWKSKMRKAFTDNDKCDGEGLENHENWFHERNKVLGFDKKAKPLPEKAFNYIKTKL